MVIQFKRCVYWSNKLFWEVTESLLSDTCWHPSGNYSWLIHAPVITPRWRLRLRLVGRSGLNPASSPGAFLIGSPAYFQKLAALRWSRRSLGSAPALPLSGAAAFSPPRARPMMSFQHIWKSVSPREQERVSQSREKAGAQSTQMLALVSAG